MLELIFEDGLKIPLEEECHGCVNGRKTYAGGSKESECPFCKGTGLDINKNGKAILELIKKYSK